ncbi:ISAs1 family transposase [Burkholderia ubonensis]|uniref:ISAs1 family transposase n=1 Tax=Burkholderia ubonensis TaxID=101571 RepID=UPI0012FA77C7|nr:ISAs1 family transposase [Burkholderia ubonensis]
MAVKENQPSLLAEIRASLEEIERLPVDDRAICANEFREVEKDHGWIETRCCVFSDLLSKWRPVALWPGIRSIAMVERRYYVSSLPPDVAHIAHAVRLHWCIENSMHWALDVAFGEDLRSDGIRGGQRVKQRSDSDRSAA